MAELTPLTISVEQASEITGLSKWYIRDQVYRGHIFARRAGRRVLIEYDSLVSFLASLDEAA